MNVGVEEAEIVAIIPTLGRDVARLRRAVDAVRGQDLASRLAIVVVLNSRDDIDVESTLGEDCSILRPGVNLGWAGGLALGRTLAESARALWLVQDDMVPESSCLGALVAALQEDPSLACVSPLVVTAVGDVAAASCGGVLRYEPDFDMDHWYPPDGTRVEELDQLDLLDYVPSRGMLVDLGAWDAVGGMFAGYYPVLWADVDFCAGVRAIGRRFSLVLEARTQHDGNGSTPNQYAQFLYERHRRLFFSRWGGQRAAELPGDELPVRLASEIARAAASLSTDLSEAYASIAADRDAAIARIQHLEELSAQQQTELTAFESQLEASAERRDEILESHRVLLGAHELLQARLRELERDRDVLTREISDLRASTSWRVTRAGRALGRVLRRRG